MKPFRNLRIAVPLLASLVASPDAGIVQVNGRKYDVQDAGKGPTVTDVLTNSQVSDPQLYFKAVETNLTLESIVNLGKVNGPLVLKLLKAHNLFYDASKPAEAVVEKAAELVGSYLAGNKISLDPASAKDALDYLKTASKDDLRQLLRWNFTRGVEAFERNLKIFEGINDSQTLDERTAEEYLKNDRRVAALPVYKKAIAEDIVSDVQNGAVAKFVEGTLQTSDLEAKLRDVRNAPSDDAVLKDVYGGKERAIRDIEEKQGKSLYKVGRSLVDAGRYKEAVPIMERCVSLMPNDARAHNCLGVAYGETGSLLLAVNEYTVAKQHDPINPEPYYNLAVTLSKLDRHEEALFFAETYLKIGVDPKFLGRAREYVTFVKASLKDKK